MFIYLREGKKKGWETLICEIHWLVASHIPSAGDLAHNPGMCPDWESNQWPFDLQAGTQSTEPHQPGHYFIFKSSPCNFSTCKDKNSNWIKLSTVMFFALKVLQIRAAILEERSLELYHFRNWNAFIFLFLLAVKWFQSNLSLKKKKS